MTAPVEIKINGKRLMKALHAAPEELYKALKTAADHPKDGIGARYFGFHAARRLRGQTGIRGTSKEYPPPSKAAGFTSKRVRRVSTEGTTLDLLKMKITLATPLAIQHEVGELIRRRGNVWMSVPMSGGPAVDKMGRKTAKGREMLRMMRHHRQAAEGGFRLWKQTKRGSQQIKGLFVVRHKHGDKRFLAQVGPKTGKRRLVYWFHLERSAQLKPRLDFRKLWSDYRPAAIKRLNGAITAALQEARKKARSAIGAVS